MLFNLFAYIYIYICVWGIIWEDKNKWFVILPYIHFILCKIILSNQIWNSIRSGFGSGQRRKIIRNHDWWCKPFITLIFIYFWHFPIENTSKSSLQPWKNNWGVVKFPQWWDQFRFHLVMCSMAAALISHRRY